MHTVLFQRRNPSGNVFEIKEKFRIFWAYFWQSFKVHLCYYSWSYDLDFYTPTNSFKNISIYAPTSRHQNLQQICWMIRLNEILHVFALHHIHGMIKQVRAIYLSLFHFRVNYDYIRATSFMLGTIEIMFRLHAIHKHVYKYPKLCTRLCLGYKLMLGTTRDLCYLSLAAIRF